MREAKETAERLNAFSDGVFAVIVTIMVLELKAPEERSFSALLPLWPIALSYAVSYLFIAIIWINHHHLMRFVGPPTLTMIWTNFIHLFLVSLLPFATAWTAKTQLASQSVIFYAGLFICIDMAYNAFEYQALTNADAAYGEGSIAYRPRGFHDRHAGGDRRPAPRVRCDMRSSDAPPAARFPADWCVTVLYGQRR
jgi:uncharacterized membrane protein